VYAISLSNTLVPPTGRLRSHEGLRKMCHKISEVFWEFFFQNKAHIQGKGENTCTSRLILSP